ncbi:hypothetical protein S245_061009, partial [Arachis hypogaea]
LRLPLRLRPRVHRGELYKTHTTNLEDPTLLKEKVNVVSLDLGCGKILNPSVILLFYDVWVLRCCVW